MTLEEFENLAIGDRVQFMGKIKLVVGTDIDYYFQFDPPKEFTYEIFCDDGTSLKIVDPKEWIENTFIKYEGDCPYCRKQNLTLLQDFWVCQSCSYIQET